MEHSSSCCLLVRQLDHPSRPCPCRYSGWSWRWCCSWARAWRRRCGTSSAGRSAAVGGADRLWPGSCCCCSPLGCCCTAAGIHLPSGVRSMCCRREEQSAVIVIHHKHWKQAKEVADSTQTSSTIEVIDMGSATVKRMVSSRPCTNYKTIHWITIACFAIGPSTSNLGWTRVQSSSGIMEEVAIIGSVCCLDRTNWR